MANMSHNFFSHAKVILGWQIVRVLKLPSAWQLHLDSANSVRAYTGFASDYYWRNGAALAVQFQSVRNENALAFGIHLPL